MRHIRRSAGQLAGGLLLLLPLSALAAEHQGTEQKPVENRPSVTAENAKRQITRLAAPTYNPPRRGMSAHTLRVGGGTRGPGVVQPRISVLAPDHLGITRQDQPTLFWYASSPLANEVLFTLIASDEATPTAVARLHAPMRRGIYAINLADLGIRLETGKTYEWSVAVVADHRRRSHDVVAMGEIEYVPPQERPVDDYVTCAQQGMWYDAVMALSKLLDEQPTDMQLRAHRAALADAVGLEMVSRFDRTVQVYE